MNRLIILCGISGSGKSTYAAKLAVLIGGTIVCPDSLRKEVRGDESDMKADGHIWNELVPLRLREALTKGHAVFDATQLNPKARKPIIAIGKEMGAQIEAHFFPPDVVKAKEQNLMRLRQVPSEIIDKQSAKWKEPSLDEGFADVIGLHERGLEWIEEEWASHPCNPFRKIAS